MSARGSTIALADARRSSEPNSGLGQLILARIATAGGATRSSVTRDLAPFLSHKLSPGEWRHLCETAIFALAENGALSKRRGRLHPSPEGQREVTKFLGQKPDDQRPWQTQRDIVLIAKALGLENESQARLKALARPDGLRSMIVQKAFGLPLRKNQSAAKVRAQLALIALERAFGNKIKASFGPKASLPARASRLLAAQLSERPREFETDNRLIAHLAAELTGARRPDIDELRLAILRKFAASLLSGAADAPVSGSRARTTKDREGSVLEAANDIGRDLGTVDTDPRPDLDQFTRVVTATAKNCAEGWPGNFKAFISRVWRGIRISHSEWSLSEIEFKCMLVAAHRAGRIVLASADLKNKTSMAEIQSSAVSYKNTVWHFIRVEE